MRWPTSFGILCAAVLAALLVSASAMADPIFSRTGPDAEAYGAAENYPVGRSGHLKDQRVIVGTFSHFDTLFSHHLVARPAEAAPLKRAELPLALSYVYRGETHTLDDYLSRHPVTGLLIAKDDTILAERYQYGRRDTDRLVSQSMAKTVTSMLVGLAVEDKAIASIDDLVETYVPALKGTEYGATPLRALLHMSFGVAYFEDYGGSDDGAKLARGLFRRGKVDAASVVAQFNNRTAPPGTRFYYAGIETEILGLVVSKAIGRPLADYLRERIWQPMGAEADATWIVDGGGQETAYCCISAVLRDYARLGLLLAHDGVANGKQIIPRDWLIAATTVRPDDGYLAPRKMTPFYGYGYQVWLLPGPKRMFAFLGIHGQAIFVDPESQVVMVHTAVRMLASKDPAAAEMVSLWYGVLKALAH